MYPNNNADGETLVESMAILQYLEDTRPKPSLTPENALSKARMWEICETIVSGIQPLQNISLLDIFESQEKFFQNNRVVCARGLQTLEDLLQKSVGSYCVGNQLTMADLCLVPQLYNATAKFKLNVDKYRTVKDLYEKLLKEEVFRATHPTNIKAK